MLSLIAFPINKDVIISIFLMGFSLGGDKEKIKAPNQGTCESLRIPAI
jgi:hypothetical protein